jgi:hypothetical protein
MPPLSTWFDEDKEKKIYVLDDFSLDVVGQGDVTSPYGNIVNVFHVPNLSTNLLCVA